MAMQIPGGTRALGRQPVLGSIAAALRPRDVFVTAVSLLVSIGTVMVFSASAYHGSVAGDVFYFLRRQLAWLPIAVLVCLVFRQLDYRILQRHAGKLILASGILLGIVLLPQVGRNVNESRRWLPLGPGIGFQPSELAKLAVIVFVAAHMSANAERPRTFVRGFLLVCAAVLPIFGLVLVEPDFGTSMFILALAFFVLLLSGVRKLYLIASAVIFAPIIAGFVYWRWEMIQARLLGFLEPDKVYQVKHSLTALGSGGVWGLGLGASAEKLQFLPEPHTDFILSILGEELGFAGTVGILLLFVVLLWSGVGMVWRTRDLFGFLVGAGIVLALAFQAALNIAVVTASMPTKGIPLPLLTHGGSGLCATLAQVGLLLSIDRIQRKESLDLDAASEAAAVPAARRAAG
jgi:cell division protein FtsW